MSKSEIALAATLLCLSATVAFLKPAVTPGAMDSEQRRRTRRSPFIKAFLRNPMATDCLRARVPYEDGKKVYAESCAACHGEKLEGLPPPGAGGDKLIGGRGSLASAAPVKTVESYWPYASTLFDYVKRAMPFNAPGNLTDDQVYAVTAYILGEANIVPKTAVMDAASLPKVEMPNRKGFVPDPRPEIELYR